METLAFDSRQQAVFETLTSDVLKISEIEGVRLDAEQVRSSLSRSLAIDIGSLKLVSFRPVRQLPILGSYERKLRHSGFLRSEDKSCDLTNCGICR